MEPKAARSVMLAAARSLGPHPTVETSLWMPPMVKGATMGIK